MTDTVREFRNALADGDQARAVELSEDLLDRIDARSERERGIESTVRSVSLDRSVGTDALEKANEVSEALDAAERARTSIAYLVLDLAQGGVDEQTAVESVDALISAEEDVTAAVEDLRGSGALASVGPKIVVVSAEQSVRVSKGTAASIPFTVENPGGAAASDVTLSLSTESPVSLSTTEVEQIDAGESKDAHVTVPGSLDAGEHRIQVVVESAEANAASIALSARVLSKRDRLQQAVTELDDLEARVEAALEDHNRPARPFRKRIGRIRNELDDIAARIETGVANEARIDGRIDRALNWFNGLTGLLNSLNQLPEGVQASLVSDGESVQETVVEAKAAAL